jgi:replication-associated recombination protein RarA
MTSMPKPTGRFRPTANGYARDEVVSALQKAIRRSQERPALFWAQELTDSGYIEYAWKRLLIITSEDIGLAWPEGPAVIRALYENHRDALKRAKTNGTGRGSGLPVFLTHAVLLLVRADKSRIVDHALLVTRWSGVLWEIPDEALDQHTRRGRKLNRDTEHFFAHAAHLAPKPKLPDPYRAEARQLARQTDGRLFADELDHGLELHQREQARGPSIDHRTDR